VREFEPRPYQQIALAHLLDVPRCALWAGMGMGKTCSTLAALDALALVESHPTLVLAPLRVARDTWPAETRKWRQFSHIEISPIVGTPAERERAMQRDVPVYTTNYEQLPGLVDHYGDRWPFRQIVSDESTRLKSFRLRQGGQRAAALGRVAHKHVHRFIELTGTPSPNGLEDLWGQAWMLDQGVRLGRTFSAFQQRWFHPTPGGQGYTQWKAKPEAQEQIQDKLRDLCLTLDPKDWFDLREPIVNTIRVPLPAKARGIYRDMEREMFASLGDGKEIEAFGAAARTLKCLQLANGAAYVDEDCKEFVEVHDAKLQALDSIVEEAAGAAVLVAYHFKSDRARILRAFKGAVDVATKEGMADFKAGRARLGIGHPASMGHGVDGLQDVCSIAAFFGHWWSMEERMQFIERIGPVRQQQAGFDRAVTIHNIVAEDTVDELVLARHDTKRSVQDLLLEAMKRRTP
jgi:SNF2 family DNA or RNA helicase